MWSKTQTLLSLFEWAEFIGINPYFMAQIGQPREDIAKMLGACQTVFLQSGHYNAENLGRDEIAEAIAQAEAMMRGFLGIPAAPLAVTQTVLYPRPANLEYGQLWYQASGRLKPIKLQDGKIISTGSYTDTLVEAEATPVFDNPYSDAFDTRFTITTTVAAGTTADEIHCYYSTNDRIGLDLDQSEIKPVKVSISGNTATITGHKTCLVPPALMLTITPQPLDATDASTFVTEVDVYRRTIDLSDSGLLIWEHIADCENPPCSHAISAGCFAALDTEGGWVVPVPAEYDDAQLEFSRLYPAEYWAPDSVQVNYIAGFGRQNNRMRPQLARAIAQLACTLLPTKAMGCERADQRMHWFRMQAGEEGFLANDIMVNAAARHFGSIMRGAVLAYQAVKDLRRGESVTS